MSTQHPEPATPVTLPEITHARIDEIESALFAEIARDRSTRTARRSRRGRLWIAGGAAAAVIAVAAVIAPSVGSLVSGAGGGDSSAIAPNAPAQDAGGGAESGARSDSADTGFADQPAADESAASDAATSDRDIITTASASVAVDDVESAARAIGEAAVAHDGYVESMSIGTDGTVYPVDPMTGAVVDSTMPPPAPDSAWVTVRVPADQLSAVVDELAETGEVTATSINRQDVTEQTVDLEARIEAAQASVDRLTELMSQAQSVADLLAAESALAERQATLEAQQQQLKMLESQVAMSSLTVSVVPQVETVEADPAGFADGLLAGWNGLVATLNGIVVALGFLLPWLVVAGFAAVIVWIIVRLVSGRRARRSDAAARSSQADRAG